MKDRPNPRGLSRDQESSQIEKIGDGRNRLFALAPTDAAPLREEVGEAVKDWSAVHNIWISDRTLLGGITYARVRPWRFFATAPQPTAAGVREGAWIPDLEVEVALTLAAVTAGRPGSYVWETRGCEKMYFQVVEIVNEGDDNDDIVWLQEQLYGYMREDDDIHAVVVNSPNAGDGGGTQPVEILGQLMPMAREDTIYSSAWGDFTVVRNGVNSVNLSDVPFAFDASMILGVVVKAVGAINETTERYRGAGLACAYTAASGQLDLGGAFTIGASDIIIVYIDGPHKSIDLPTQSRRAKVINPDSKFVTTDGLFIDVTKEAQEADDYFPFMMGQDGHHWLASIVALTGAATLNLEATLDLDADGNEIWYDVTQEVLGVAQVTIANDGIAFPPQCWIGWRRMRWVVGETGAGGTARVFMMRSAYGNNWVPVAREGQAALGTGFEIMGHARATQAAAIDEDDSGQFVMNLFKEWINAAYIWATQADRTEEDDPTDTRDNTNVMAEVTGEDDGTFDYFLDMAHMTKAAIQIENVDGAAGDNTYTIWGSEQDDGTAPNAVAYQNITQFGCDNMIAANAAAYTADVLLQTNAAGLSYKWIRVRVIRANDGDNDDGEWTIRARPLYH